MRSDVGLLGKQERQEDFVSHDRCELMWHKNLNRAVAAVQSVSLLPHPCPGQHPPLYASCPGHSINFSCCAISFPCRRRIPRKIFHTRALEEKKLLSEKMSIFMSENVVFKTNSVISSRMGQLEWELHGKCQYFKMYV